MQGESMMSEKDASKRPGRGWSRLSAGSHPLRRPTAASNAPGSIEIVISVGPEVPRSETRLPSVSTADGWTETPF